MPIAPLKHLLRTWYRGPSLVCSPLKQQGLTGGPHSQSLLTARWFALSGWIGENELPYGFNCLSSHIRAVSTYSRKSELNYRGWGCIGNYTLCSKIHKLRLIEKYLAFLDFSDFLWWEAFLIPEWPKCIFNIYITSILKSEWEHDASSLSLWHTCCSD